MPVPLLLTAKELEFLSRVEGYCAEGLTQDEMAQREGVRLSSFRYKLLYCGFEIEATTCREVVRIRTRERITELRDAGLLVIEEPRQPVEVA